MFATYLNILAMWQKIITFYWLENLVKLSNFNRFQVISNFQTKLCQANIKVFYSSLLIYFYLFLFLITVMLYCYVSWVIQWKKRLSTKCEQRLWSVIVCHTHLMCVELVFDLLHVVRHVVLHVQRVFGRQQPGEHLFQRDLIRVQTDLHVHLHQCAGRLWPCAAHLLRLSRQTLHSNTQRFS